MGPLGWQETVFIFVLALLIFGPKKLPELGKTIGKAMTEFRRASSELKETFNREMSSLERENESLKEVTRDYQNQINSATYDYNSNYGYDDSSYYDSGAYGSESYDSTATQSSTVSASATEGAESAVSATENGEHAVATEVASAEVTTGESGTEPDPDRPSNGAPAPEKLA